MLLPDKCTFKYAWIFHILVFDMWWKMVSYHHCAICVITSTSCEIYIYIYIQINHLCITHWGRVTHICIGNLTIIGSDNGLSPGRQQDIIWTNAGILLIGPLGTNFSEISVKILTFSLKKIHLNMSAAKWWPSCLGLNMLILLVLNPE